MSQADYFYVLSAKHRWPRGFIRPNSPAKVLLVERNDRNVHWSEPADFVIQQGGLQEFLEKIREAEPPHRDGYNCFSANGLPLTISPEVNSERDARFLALPGQQFFDEGDAVDKNQVDKLVAKLMRILGDSPDRSRIQALLLLGELGPQGRPAAALIRQALAADDPRLSRVAALALAKIEKK